MDPDPGGPKTCGSGSYSGYGSPNTVWKDEQKRRDEQAVYRRKDDVQTE